MQSGGGNKAGAGCLGEGEGCKHLEAVRCAKALHKEQGQHARPLWVRKKAGQNRSIRPHTRTSQDEMTGKRCAIERE